MKFVFHLDIRVVLQRSKIGKLEISGDVRVVENEEGGIPLSPEAFYA